MRKTTRLEQLHQMIVDPGEECIIWPYGKNGDGYGTVRSDGREQMAHRCALISTTGPAPAGMEAAHGPCHTRACVNPRHLSWKTRTQNEADKVRDGTSGRGEANVRSKLTESEVLTIRSEHAAGGVSYSMLGRRFNVSPYTIGNIVRRQAWGWLSVTNVTTE